MYLACGGGKQVAKHLVALQPRRTEPLAAAVPPISEVIARRVTAAMAAEIPRWFLREELRSFDHIHPNSEGHRLIAEAACPRLPASWGCECPNALATAPTTTPVSPAAQRPAALNLLLLLYPPWLRTLLGLPRTAR